jgi:hypothetical protein
MKATNSGKLLRAIRLANEAKNRKTFPSKGEVHAKQIESHLKVKRLRQSERREIELGLTEFEELSGASRPLNLKGDPIGAFRAQCPALASL